MDFAPSRAPRTAVALAPWLWMAAMHPHQICKMLVTCLHASLAARFVFQGQGGIAEVVIVAGHGYRLPQVGAGCLDVARVANAPKSKC